MTVELTDRIEMAESNDRRLDYMFELLERMPVPEGYKAEIVEGTITMSPQRSAHWEIIRRIVRALEDHFGMDIRVMSDVRIDLPGHENGFSPDVALLKDSAEFVQPDGSRGWRYQDVEFIAEVISRGTAANDYGPKRDAYALAEVPVLLIADPYTATCHVHTHPKGGEYQSRLIAKFGEEIDLTGTVLGLTLSTAEFPSEDRRA
ncbi:Uma2 family endonuclease [Streptomyces armeniacus]|uniref:Uma2 family endonuclease n=1 Tax=Streptomyces armeniacus TaxID=83291 RepID=A0A345XN08_9ACTN|nr:Uma2 family endonuclease [Streptomyces armeniacus]AXK33024.1 Uma2 family endonuclease [Streptomyces armeniacus]